MIKQNKKEETINNDCFIIMPIADTDGYEKGHFKKVYEDILKPACCKANFNPVRADEVKQTNLIHLDILQKLIDSPMAICDLSNRNPNVLFELGLRQAFDKPTVLVQEFGTPKIFDISPLRYTEYRKELKYREVLEDQDFIYDALKATKEATDKGEGVNSIVSLLSLSSPASLKEVTDNDAAKMLQIVMSEMNDLRMDFRRTLRKMDEKEIVISGDDNIRRSTSDLEYLRFRNRFQKFKEHIVNNAPIETVKELYDLLQNSAVRLSDVELSHNRQRQMKEIYFEIDSLFSNYLANGKQ
jgi:hypothetical protein